MEHCYIYDPTGTVLLGTGYWGADGSLRLGRGVDEVVKPGDNVTVEVGDGKDKRTYPVHITAVSSVLFAHTTARAA